MYEQGVFVCLTTLAGTHLSCMYLHVDGIVRLQITQMSSTFLIDSLILSDSFGYFV